MRLRPVSSLAAAGLALAVLPLTGFPASAANSTPAPARSTHRQAVAATCAKVGRVHIGVCARLRTVLPKPASPAPAGAKPVAGAVVPHGAPSPDVLFWAHSDPADSGYSIVSAASATSTVISTVLTGSINVDFDDPEVSPDGQKLLYSKMNYGSGTSSIEVRDLATGVTTVPVETGPGPGEMFFAPTWATDSTTLAYAVVNTAGPTPVFTVATTTSADHGSSTALPYSATAPAWDLTTGRLTFTRLDTQNLAWVTVPPAGPATTIPGSDGAVESAWSADGSTIAFTKPGLIASTTSLATLPAAGGVATEIVPADGDIESPAWSSDGQSVYFSQDSVNGSGVPAGQAQLRRVPSYGVKVMTIFPDGSDNVEISVGASAAAPAPPLSGMSYDFSGDGHPDLMTVGADGQLRLYTGNGARIVGVRVVGRGWSGFTAVFSPGDWTGDGRPDLIGRTASGDLMLYVWSGTTFTSRRQIGSGWQTMGAVLSPGDFTGDHHPDLIGRGADGVLRLYPGTATGLTGGVRVIGSGWNAMTAVFSTGDFTGDGHADLLGRSTDGVLHLYLGNGVAFAGARTIGVGWNAMTAFDGSTDWTGDHHADLLARTSAGSLVLYRGNGTAFASASLLGAGWNSMTALS